MSDTEDRAGSVAIAAAIAGSSSTTPIATASATSTSPSAPATIRRSASSAAKRSPATTATCASVRARAAPAAFAGTTSRGNSTTSPDPTACSRRGSPGTYRIELQNNDQWRSSTAISTSSCGSRSRSSPASSSRPASTGSPTSAASTFGPQRRVSGPSPAGTAASTTAPTPRPAIAACGAVAAVHARARDHLQLARPADRPGDDAAHHQPHQPDAVAADALAVNPGPVQLDEHSSSRACDTAGNTRPAATCSWSTATAATPSIDAASPAWSTARSSSRQRGSGDSRSVLSRDRLIC